MAQLFIKNMVCNRCIMVVKQQFDQLGIEVIDVQLGEVTLPTELKEASLSALDQRLSSLGFELIHDKKNLLVEQIKTRIIELVHHQQEDLRINLSDYLTQNLHHDYSYLSNLFSDTVGTTIEKYFIAQRIEKVKELLLYDECTLSEIANQLHYSSVAYLSNQFKKITGMTPTQFRKSQIQQRKPLDHV
jgi:AraC-like DNA-binding protein